MNPAANRALAQCNALPVECVGIQPAPERSKAPASVRMRESRDDEALMHLVNEASFRHSASHLDPSPSLEIFRAWLASLGNDRFEAVAEIDAHVIGYCGLFIYPQRRNHAGWLFIGVRESYRGIGIGEKLLRALIAASDILFGLGRLELTVYADNNAALNLYRKNGFEIEGRHKNFVRRGTEYIDAYSMVRIRTEAGPPKSMDEFRARIKSLAPFMVSDELWRQNG
jgi:putative acetyltransferase